MGEGEGGEWSYSGGQRQWTRLPTVADTTPVVDKVADGGANEGGEHRVLLSPLFSFYLGAAGEGC